MSSTRIFVKNWNFVELNGDDEYNTNKYYTFTPDTINTNGWECHAFYDSIECRAIREYQDGIHFISLSIYPNGFYIVNRDGNIIKKGKVKPNNTGEYNMEIILSGGNIYDRFVSVRDAQLRKFLLDHRINAIKHKDPNGLYKLDIADYGCAGIQYNRLVVSKGGEEEKILVDKTPGYHYWYESTVKNARWVVHTQKYDNGRMYRTLITKEDIFSLKDELSFLKK